MLNLLSHPQSSITAFVRSALDKLHSLGLVPRSRYTTSWDGLTFRQAIHMPLPPYLSPLPVIFRMLAYAVITPFVLLLFLDVGGYIVWRIYEGVSLTGTRTAFYKFRTSPVFVRSRAGSPVLGKDALSKQLGPSPPRSPEMRETSISPISSSTSLQDETYGMNSDGELEPTNSSSSSSSPGGYSHTLPTDIQGPESRSAVSALDTANLDSSIRRRTVRDHSNSSGKRFSMGSDGEDDSLARKEEREQTPTLISTMVSASPHLTRSNSLGLGLGTRSSQAGDSTGSNSNVQVPSMYIASSHNRSIQRVTSGEDLVEVSPAASTASSSNLEDDDAIFNEAKEIN